MMDAGRETAGAAGVTDGVAARFAREWNAAFGLVAVAATLLIASGHVVAGVAALALCLAAVLARARAMRRQGRGFYGRPVVMSALVPGIHSSADAGAPLHDGSSGQARG
jgi:hypothetical protein